MRRLRGFEVNTAVGRNDAECACSTEESSGTDLTMQLNGDERANDGAMDLKSVPQSILQESHAMRCDSTMAHVCGPKSYTETDCRNQCSCRQAEMECDFEEDCQEDLQDACKQVRSHGFQA